MFVSRPIHNYIEEECELRVQICWSAVLCLTLGLVQAPAATITFTATGVAGISGYVSFDDSLFDGTNSQSVWNGAIVDLSLDVFGSLFSLGDVVTSDFTLIDSSGAIPRIVNGNGLLADNGSRLIAFFPDGHSGSASDGDASLAFGFTDASVGRDYYAVRWDAAPAEVPEPSALALFGAGLAGLGLLVRFQALAGK